MSYKIVDRRLISRLLRKKVTRVNLQKLSGEGYDLVLGRSQTDVVVLHLW